MIDLDALVPEYEEVRYKGETYKVPRGLDAMPLAAIIAGQRAQTAFAKLGQNNAQVTVEDVHAINKLIHEATQIPLDVVRTMSMPMLQQLIGILFPQEKDAKGNPQKLPREADET